LANFDSGVKRYIKARAVVEVGFPVSWGDSADISCKHCKFFDRAKQRCWLTQSVVNYPDNYIGADCPLEPIEEEMEKENV
jgi:hypothetical protein